MHHAHKFLQSGSTTATTLLNISCHKPLANIIHRMAHCYCITGSLLQLNRCNERLLM